MKVRHVDTVSTRSAVWAEIPRISFTLMLLFALPSLRAEGTFITASNRADLAYDNKRSVLYISNGNELVRYDVAGRRDLPPLALGNTLRGMDISPDGGTLAVADEDHSQGTGAIYLVNLSNLTVARIVTPPLIDAYGNEYAEGSFTVAYGADGAILISGTEGDLWRYVPSTGAFSHLAGGLGEEVMLKASPDRSIIGLAMHTVGAGPYGRYRIADGDLYIAPAALDDNPSNLDIDVRRDSQEFAMYAGGNVELYDSALQQETFSYAGVGPGAALGVTYSPAKNFIYFGWSPTSLVYAFDTSSHRLVRNYDFEAPFGPFFYAPFLGRMKTSTDGSLLFATVPGGVRFITLDALAPTGLMAATGDGQITLSWNASPNATSYDVYVESSPAGEDPPPTETGITGTSTTITGLTNNIQYFFRVAARTPSGLSTPTSAVSGTPVALPGPITGFGASANFGGATLVWATTPHASSYTLYQGTSSGSEKVLETDIDTNDYGLVLAGYGVDYYFQVAGANAAGLGPRSPEIAILHAAAPKPSRPGGTYSSPQLITLTDSANDAEIYYTTDNSVPTTASTYANGPILIDKTMTVKSFATASAASNSAVTTVDYAIESLLPAASSVDLSTSYDVVAIRNDGVQDRDGIGIDGHGSALPSDLIGNGVVFESRGFPFGLSNNPNAVSDATILLPAGKFASLQLIATGVNGNQKNQTVVIHYTDGSSTTAIQSFSDWHTFQAFPGEAITATASYCLNMDGSRRAGTYHVYGYSIPINASKRLKSVTLPHNKNVVLLSAAAVPSPGIALSLAAAANTYAISTDGAATIGGGIDGAGDAYSSTQLGTSVVWNGVPFTLLSADHVDAVDLVGTALPAAPGSFSKLNILATAVNGAKLNQQFVVNYTDGTTQHINQSLSDWRTPQNYAGETKVLTMPYALKQDGSKQVGSVFLYGFSFAIDATKTVKSVGLPQTKYTVVLAVTLSP